MEPKGIITFFHICICIALILIVLLQKGKGAGMGAAFGGSSQTVFGSAGSSGFMQKVTTIVAVLFMLLSLSLSLPYFSEKNSSSGGVMEGFTQSEEAPAPTTDTGEAPAATETAPDEAQ